MKIKQQILYYNKLFDFFIEDLRRIGFIKHKILNISNSGINYTIELPNIYIKLKNSKRQKQIKNNWPLFFLMELNSFEEMKKKFVYFNRKKAHILKAKEDILVLEKINAKPLSFYLNDTNFLALVEKSLLKLKNGWENKFISHGDFHIDNILVNENLDIFFIDFDFKYKTIHYQFEYDILKFLFYIKKYYQYNINLLKPMIFKYADKTNLLKAKNNIKKYLQGNLDEFFD